MVGFFIQRPVFASAIAMIMVLAGAISYFLLPVSQFPDITPPQVVVSAVYPGASAQVVADTVTTPLEQQINGVAGMTYMSSSSSNDGSSNITITFDVGYPLSIAAVDVQNRVSQAASSLPPIVNQAGVTIKKQNPNFVLIVNLVSPDGSVDPVALSNYAYLQVLDPLKRVPGVGDVQIFGERRYSMRVWLDPDKLANLGITATDVQNAVAEQNIQVAAGKIGQSPAPEGTAFEMQVSAIGRLGDPAQFGDIVVRANPSAGSVVRLRDVARVELGALQYASSGFFGADPTVVLAIYQMPGSNALDLQKNIKNKMEELSKRFPKGIEYAMHYDTTRFVSAAMRDVVITLAEALLLVVAVVFIFLQSWRTTLIPIIAIPVSLIATLAVMLMLGFSLNMLSLLGMVLAIGLVVDDAIVVVENVERQLEAGLRPLQAARAAMKEVTGPIIATTAVLMAVFIPVAFIPGVSGRLYNQFALTVAISVGISAFNSLTLSPALAAAFLRHRGEVTFAPFRWFNSGFEWLAHRYAQSVRTLGSSALGCARTVRGDGGRDLCGLDAYPVDLPAGRGPGLFLRRHPIAGWRLAAADRRGCEAGTRSADERAWRRHRRLDQRPELPDQRRSVQFGGGIRHPEALGRAAAGAECLEDRGTGASEAVSASRRGRAELRSALDPGLRRDRRLRIPGRGSDRPRQRRAQRGDSGRYRGSAQAAGDQPAAALHLVQHLDAAVQLRSRPQQGQAARPQSAGRLQHAADLSRLALCQRLQPVRPHLPRDAAGRQGCARLGVRLVASLCAQQYAVAWCR